MDELEKFIVKAKANGWVAAEAGGKRIPSSKIGSLDITYEIGPFHYHDSFVGMSDFCGQEHVALSGEAVWSMAYYGHVLRPEAFSGKETATLLKQALAKMYGEGRFLGGFYFRHGDLEYCDSNDGDYRRFTGGEKILKEGEPVYELHYFGGLVRP